MRRSQKSLIPLFLLKVASYVAYTWKWRNTCFNVVAVHIGSIIANTRRPSGRHMVHLWTSCCFPSVLHLLGVDGKQSPGDVPHGRASLNPTVFEACMCQWCTEESPPPDQDACLLPSTVLATHSSKGLLWGCYCAQLAFRQTPAFASFLSASSIT